MEINESDETDKDFSESATGYKIFTGYNFGTIPLLDFALEGSYISTGKMSDEISGRYVPST